MGIVSKTPPSLRKATAALVCLLGMVAIAATVLAGEFPPSWRTVFAVEEEGPLCAALSSNGRQVVLSGSDRALYLVELDTQEKKLLLRDARTEPVGPPVDTFSCPAFSPDGSQIVFSASGGTVHYASDIYLLKLDGSGLRQLTRSRRREPEDRPPEIGPPGGGPWMLPYAEYFSTPELSPDGKQILLHYVDNSADWVESVAVMNADGSNLRILAPGRPLFWSADGEAVYYDQDRFLKKFYLASGIVRTITRIEWRILGKLPDRDWLAVLDPEGTAVRFLDLSNEGAVPAGTWNVSPTRVTAQEILSLISVQWTPSGRALLIFEGDDVQRLEVIEGAGP